MVSPAGDGGAGNCPRNFCCLSLSLGIFVSFCQLSVVVIMTRDLLICVPGSQNEAEVWSFCTGSAGDLWTGISHDFRYSQFR